MLTREQGGMTDPRQKTPDDKEPQMPEARKWYDRYKGERAATIMGIILGFFLGEAWAFYANSPFTSWSVLAFAMFGLPCLWLIFRK